MKYKTIVNLFVTESDRYNKTIPKHNKKKNTNFKT